MANKNVSLWIGNPADTVNKIGSTDYSGDNYTVQDLVNAYPSTYSLVQNPNGQTDLAWEIDDTISAVLCELVEYGSANIYEQNTVDYSGPHPTTRKQPS